MELCVGAGSRRVVEEAAKLKVPQIVASRRQVDQWGGYIGLDQSDLVTLVRDLSGGATKVIRDHGGPGKGPLSVAEDTDWMGEIMEDIAAGFDGIHVDVCMLPSEQQFDTLTQALTALEPFPISIEVGGERDPQVYLTHIVQHVLDMGITPSYAVMDVGGHIDADRQRGQFKDPRQIKWACGFYHEHGIKVKAHNCDWYGGLDAYADLVDAINIAPEFSALEVDAILMVLTQGQALDLLNDAYNTGASSRWFRQGQGTWLERAKCAVRYHPELIPELNHYQDTFVRRMISDALTHAV